MVDGLYTSSLLVCRVLGRACALPIEHVGEIMRPLRVESIPSAPSYILGMAVIRGVATPVLHLARLFGQPGARIERFVSIKVATRPLALAVEQVQGVTTLAKGGLAALPPLVQGLDSDMVESIGVRDAALFMVLDGARLLPDDAWPQPESQA